MTQFILGLARQGGRNSARLPKRFAMSFSSVFFSYFLKRSMLPNAEPSTALRSSMLRCDGENRHFRAVTFATLKNDAVFSKTDTVKAHVAPGARFPVFAIVDPTWFSLALESKILNSIEAVPIE